MYKVANENVAMNKKDRLKPPLRQSLVLLIGPPLLHLLLYPLRKEVIVKKLG
jgi:hypothetical protein